MKYLQNTATKNAAIMDNRDNPTIDSVESEEEDCLALCPSDNEFLDLEAEVVSIIDSSDDFDNESPAEDDVEKLASGEGVIAKTAWNVNDSTRPEPVSSKSPEILDLTRKEEEVQTFVCSIDDIEAERIGALKLDIVQQQSRSLKLKMIRDFMHNSNLENATTITLHSQDYYIAKQDSLLAQTIKYYNIAADKEKYIYNRHEAFYIYLNKNSFKKILKFIGTTASTWKNYFHESTSAIIHHLNARRGTTTQVQKMSNNVRMKRRNIGSISLGDDAVKYIYI